VKSSAQRNGLGTRGKADVQSVLRALDARRGGWIDGAWRPSALMNARAVARVLSVSESTAEKYLERAARMHAGVVDRVRSESGTVFWTVKLGETLAGRGPDREPVCVIAYTGREVVVTCTRRANVDAGKCSWWRAFGTRDASVPTAGGVAQRVEIANEGWEEDEIPFDYG
jgi:hypothetical protein